MHPLKMLPVALLCIAVVVSTTAAEQTPIELSTWMPVTLDLGGQPLGNWVLLDQNTTARQTTNAAPTFFLNGIDQADYEIHGTWRVGVTTDDDFVGFTFGYQDPPRCYVMDWRSNPHSRPTFRTAQEGFRILKIDAPSVSALALLDFWDENDTADKTVLASTYGAGIGRVAGAT